MKRCAVVFFVALLLGPGAVAKSAPKMSNEDCLACHNDPTLTKDENGKPVSLHVDDAKFKASIHSMFGCTDCHTDIKAFPHDPTPAKPVCATLPCRPANGLRSWRPCQGGGGRQHQCREMPGLPWQRPRDPAGQRSQIESRARQHSADLRRLSWPEICDGIQRHKFRAIQLVPAKRSRQGRGGRFRQGGGVHRLPR